MPRTMGVEEEFHLVDLKTRRLTARAPELLRVLSDSYVAELQRCVVEMNSGVVDTLDGLRADLQSQRKVLVDAAAKLGIGVVAAGAVPLSVPAEMQVTQTARYRQMLTDYQLAGARTAHLRYPGARRRRRPRRVSRCRQPGVAVCADTAGAKREFAVLVRRFRHRLLKRAYIGVATLADDGTRRAGVDGR